MAIARRGLYIDQGSAYFGRAVCGGVGGHRFLAVGRDRPAVLAMAKHWYVLHTFSGHENKVERNLRILMDRGELGDSLVDVRVPSEKIVELRDGKKRVMQKKFLPGYVLLEMDLPTVGWQAICTRLRQLNGVTGFLGTDGDTRPLPISVDELRTIMLRSGEIEGDKKVTIQQSFAIGESVRIISGPFESFTGSVEEINNEKARLRVTVGIFGRATPVEVDFLQVEKF